MRSFIDPHSEDEGPRPTPIPDPSVRAPVGGPVRKGPSTRVPRPGHSSIRRKKVENPGVDHLVLVLTDSIHPQKSTPVGDETDILFLFIPIQRIT